MIDHRLPAAVTSIDAHGIAIDNGIALARRLRALRPDLPALIVTGDVAVQWDVTRHGMRVLHKPLTGSVLTAAIVDEAAAARRWESRIDTFCNDSTEPPMNIIDAMHGRRSVRSFKPAPLPRPMVEDLLWHAAQIPLPPISNDSSWVFVLVEGQARLEAFGARAKDFAAAHQPPGQSWSWPARGDFDVFWGAPLLVLICARHGHPEAPFDACRAGQNLALVAHARGLGSCWVGSPMPWLHSDEGQQATSVPDGFDAAVALVLGWPALTSPGQSRPKPPLVWAT